MGRSTDIHTLTRRHVVVPAYLALTHSLSHSLISPHLTSTQNTAALFELTAPVEQALYRAEIDLKPLEGRVDLVPQQLGYIDADSGNNKNNNHNDTPTTASKDTIDVPSLLLKSFLRMAQLLHLDFSASLE